MQTNEILQWCIIGAGPAGIAVVGQLLDQGINGDEILWLDPEFTVGDFAKYWSEVPSNTKVQTFLYFLNKLQSFEFSNQTKNFKLFNYDPEDTCLLSDMAEPLHYVTRKLLNKVKSQNSFVTSLQLFNRLWQIKTDKQMWQARNVVIVTGAEPISMRHERLTEIPLYQALKPSQIQSACKGNDTIAVFGSSHSAILVLRNLLEQTNVKKIINFYRSPLKYAVYLEDMILFDNTGLKGTTADWARENIDGILPERLQRINTADPNYQNLLQTCHKAIYAVGFERRKIPISGFNNLNHNQHNGIIAPGLFGFGIAHPQILTDRFGNIEQQVGLRKFINYLETIMPIWLRYPT